MKEDDTKFTNLLVSVTKLQSDIKYIIESVDQSKKEWEDNRKLGVSHYIKNSTIKLEEINQELSSLREDVNKNNDSYDDLTNKIKWINFELKAVRWTALITVIIAIFMKARYLTIDLDVEKIIPLLSFYGFDFLLFC
jgi:chromosome segregation ATPase